MTPEWSPGALSALGSFWFEADTLTRGVVAVLACMSVSAWVLILWKGWSLRRVRGDIERAVAAFWSARDFAEGRRQIGTFDREGILAPLADAAIEPPIAGSLEASSGAAAHLTRRLRDALHAASHRLRFGQVALASIGSTAPFVGLLGTVWGIYQALQDLSGAEAVTIGRLSGPMGEALVMTAAGLVVAIPAVLAFNVLGKLAAACEARLEGFAHDLREVMAGKAKAVNEQAVATLA